MAMVVKFALDHERRCPTVTRAAMFLFAVLPCVRVFLVCESSPPLPAERSKKEVSESTSGSTSGGEYEDEEAEYQEHQMAQRQIALRTMHQQNNSPEVHHND